MQSGVALDGSKNLVTSSETVSLSVDAETALKLGDAADSSAEAACSVIMVTDGE